MRSFLFAVTLLACCPVYGEEKQPKLSGKEQVWAKENALQAYLAKGGARRSNPKSSKGGMRYTEGELKGLTRDQAVAKFNQLWAKTSGAQRAKWAKMGPPAKSEEQSEPSVVYGTRQGDSLQLDSGEQYAVRRGELVPLGQGGASHRKIGPYWEPIGGSGIRILER